MAEFIHPLIQKIQEKRPVMTPKARTLSDRVLASPRKVVFMTIRELAEYCGVSEATVVRFTSQLDFKGYSDFQQALRDIVDTEMTLLERLDLSDLMVPGGKLFSRLVHQEIDNLKQLHESLDLSAADRVVDLMLQSPQIYVIGSRLSYTVAYYLGWSLSTVRSGIQIFKGSDDTTLDWLTIAPENTLAVILATSRYPNDLLTTAKAVRRQGKTLVSISDSAGCPVNQFAQETLIAPSRHIPFIGSPAALVCLVSFLTQQLASKLGDDLKAHQTTLEKSYVENDLFFNLYFEKS